jgi:hypothetical protein
VTIASVIDCRHYGFFWLLIKLISDFDAKSGAFLAGTAVERQDLPHSRHSQAPASASQAVGKSTIRGAEAPQSAEVGSAAPTSATKVPMRWSA